MRATRQTSALRWRARLLVSALALHMLWTVLALAYATLMFTDNGSGAGEALGAGMLLMVFAVLPTTALVLLTAALWVWRAHANLRDLGLAELDYPPTWVAASWFVPLINLVVPPRAMRELWHRSAGEPLHRARQPVAAINGWQWSLICGALLEALFVRTAFMASVPGAGLLISAPLATICGAAGAVLLLLSCGFLMMIVRRITRDQQTLLAAAMPTNA